jgi:hypothetical protein
MLLANENGQITEAYPRALPAAESCTSITSPNLAPRMAKRLPNQSTLKNRAKDLSAEVANSAAGRGEAALKQDENHEHI